MVTGMSDLISEKQKVFDYVLSMLGQGMIDIELDQKHLDIGLERALNRFRQRSTNSVEESYIFLPTIENQNDYILPDDVIEVYRIFRRSLGSRMTGGDDGSTFEPFNLAYTNAYLLASSNAGGLATFDFFSQYQEMVGRMFGAFIEFKWNRTTKKITLFQRMSEGETLLLQAYNYRPDIMLLTDYLSKQWIRDYTLASCKLILGEARSKFATIAGPGGGTTLNGDALKSEALSEMERLETEVSTQMAGGPGYSWLIG